MIKHESSYYKAGLWQKWWFILFSSVTKDGLDVARDAIFQKFNSYELNPTYLWVDWNKNEKCASILCNLLVVLFSYLLW